MSAVSDAFAQDLLEPGPALDVRLARTLWRALVVHDTESGQSFLMATNGQPVPVPAYSTDLEEAHRVVALLKNDGYTLHLRNLHEEGGIYLARFVKQDQPAPEIFCKAATLGHAICLAALEAWQSSR